jgi:hypothetical protein
MRVRPGFLIVLFAMVAFGLQWQGVAVARDFLQQQREARVEAVEAVVRSLAPPPGFTDVPCKFASATCMTTPSLPRDAAPQVAAMLEQRAAAPLTRCYKHFRSAPADCMVVVQIDGVIVVGWLYPELLPEPPIRFEGSELSFQVVDGYPSAKSFLDMHEMLFRPATAEVATPTRTQYGLT